MRMRKRTPTHPGGILKRQYIEPLSLTISELAGTLGVSRKTLSKIVNERGDVTPDMALRLSKA
ncbi:MAG TPA: HigA family addiction module antitoxin, partial [Nitrospirota bacterium]|nr:HigA family addiction module antitoxin [Nitrospirota bacterium]